jgi:hypothetical protein
MSLVIQPGFSKVQFDRIKAAPLSYFALSLLKSASLSFLTVTVTALISCPLKIEIGVNGYLARQCHISIKLVNACDPMFSNGFSASECD